MLCVGFGLLAAAVLLCWTKYAGEYGEAAEPIPTHVVARLADNQQSRAQVGSVKPAVKSSEGCLDAQVLRHLSDLSDPESTERPVIPAEVLQRLQKILPGQWQADELYQLIEAMRKIWSWQGGRGHMLATHSYALLDEAQLGEAASRGDLEARYLWSMRELAKLTDDDLPADHALAIRRGVGKQLRELVASGHVASRHLAVEFSQMVFDRAEANDADAALEFHFWRSLALEAGDVVMVLQAAYNDVAMRGDSVPLPALNVTQQADLKNELERWRGVLGAQFTLPPTFRAKLVAYATDEELFPGKDARCRP